MYKNLANSTNNNKCIVYIYDGIVISAGFSSKALTDLEFQLLNLPMFCFMLA